MTLPRTLEERRERIGGWVYSAFRMRDFFERALPRQAPGAVSHLRLEIFDADTADRAALLYDTLATIDPAAAQKIGHSTPIFRETLDLDIAGTRWTLRASSLPALEAQLDGRQPWLILAIGIACSFLLAGISGMLDYSRHRYAAAESRLLAQVEERKRAEEEARLANGELIHRVKNTLAIVTAIASQTGRHASTIEDFNRSFRSRLAGLARVQDLLGPNVAHTSDLGSFARELLAPYIGTSREALVTGGPEVKVGHSDATLLSLVLNELATNATKYGAWSTPAGKVDLTWAITEEEDKPTLELIWQERGGPPVAAPDAPGFGSSVTRVAVERGLRGQLKTDYDVAGVRHTIHVPRHGLNETLQDSPIDAQR